MAQLSFHNNNLSKEGNPPPTEFKKDNLLTKSIAVYKIWHFYFQHFSKISRYSLGVKIDNSFLEFIETAYFSIYASKNDREIIIEKLSKKLDSLKLFLQIAWEVRLLDNKKYTALSIPLAEIGKIIGGWKKQLMK